MVIIIAQALYFFLPSYIANMVPVVLDRYRLLEFLNVRVDFGSTLNGEPFFGKTKTWRGIIGGFLAGMIIVGIQYWIYVSFPGVGWLYLFPYDFPGILLLGFLFGLGEGLGDLIKSFFKRRLHIKSSGLFFPVDQMSFLGALGLSSIYYIPSTDHIIAIVIFSLIIPVISNLLGYKIGWKKVWW